jgi:hypothetical protein
MAGVMPAIHVFHPAKQTWMASELRLVRAPVVIRVLIVNRIEDVDGRVSAFGRPGHDGSACARLDVQPKNRGLASARMMMARAGGDIHARPRAGGGVRSAP